MKHIIIIFLCLFIAAGSSGQENSPDKGFSATFSITSNGFSAIPAFSLGKPAMAASVSVYKGRFSYDPALAFDLEMKPWYTDNWFRYRIIKKPSFELRTGINFSYYFTGITLDNRDIINTDRYIAAELAGSYKISSRTSVTLIYWNDNGIGEGLLRGHFVSLQGDLVNAPVGRKLVAGTTIQLFTINYDGNNDGLFISPRISLGIADFPVSVNSQANIPMWSNIEPEPDFQWTVGLSYGF